MKRLNLLFLTLVCACIGAYSQIGYQVAVMDQTTGKPKANENVAVSVTISDNAGGVICSETHDVTTNDVGIATIQVGNANTFSNVDWTKLPLWVSATVGGITISKSQILNVPVAEYAKHYGVLSVDFLCEKTWRTKNDDDGDYHTLKFNYDGTCIYKEVIVSKPSESSSKHYTYEIDGNSIMLYRNDQCDDIIYYSKLKKALVKSSDLFY